MTISVKDIKALEGVEAVRKRPGMYIGPVSTEEGVFNWLREPIDNAIDEWAQGRNKELLVWIQDPKTIVVADKGVGIPVEVGPHTKGLPAMTFVFTTLHAGAKFDSSKSYKLGKTTGMHGVGVTVTNALSKTFEVWNKRDKWYYQKFERGKPVTKLKNKRPSFLSGWNRGVVIKATLDDSIFTKTIPVGRVKQHLEDLSYLCSGLKVIFRYKDKEHVFKQPKKSPLRLLLEKYMTEPRLTKVFEYSSKKLCVALCWADTDEENIHTFVNFLRTKNGGTHVEGVKGAIYKALVSLEPKVKSYRPAELLAGLQCAVHYFTENPVFDSQVKDRLDTPEAKQEVQSILEGPLKLFFSKNRSIVSKLLRRAKKIADARKRYKELITVNRELKKITKRGLLPDKLIVSTTKDPKERELFIVEGESAKGTARKARDSRYQEVLPIKGKILNIAKASSLSKVVKNEEVQAIIRAVGTEDSPRVGRIFILTDADPDGSHIRTLLLTFFVKYMRWVIDRKMLWVIESPLYVARKGGKKVYGNSLKEIKKKLGPLKDATVTRMKGWAEASVEDLKEIAFGPKRKAYPVKIGKFGEVVIDRLMGSGTYYRKVVLDLIE